MRRTLKTIERVSNALHAQFLWLLLGSYFLAAVCPAWGLWLRDVSLGDVAIFGHPIRLSLSMLLLSALLFNAGMGLDMTQIKHLARRPGMLFMGLAANLAVPLGFICILAAAMQFWHNSDEVQNILVGLALVSAMPIAGSSTAWSQNANGNVALSLGLVFCSTLLSPLTTPIALDVVGLLTTGDYSAILHQLSSGRTNVFLMVCVILPSLAGVAVRVLLGNRRVANCGPALKLGNLLALFLLIYSNASISLPRAVSKPDYDFLAVILLVAVALCSTAFAAGWLIARLLNVRRDERVSLMFGLGMNNNGTGLVLASLALSAYPQAILPIVFYNLVQHLVAGAVDRAMA
jgi:BASS family bile acid:Na+ symporter